MLTIKPTLAAAKTTPVTENEVQTHEAKNPHNADQWLGAVRYPTRQIPDTPYFMARLGQAAEPEHLGARLNRHGYDQDNPSDAISKYEKAHPQSFGEILWNEISDAFFNMLTFFIPQTLSLSAGNNKQRIDQKVVLEITREAVDKFPELKIRMSKEAFELLHAKDQMRWHKKMSIIRAAQHDYIINELSKVYPGHIDTLAPTILYTGGRATGKIRVLYCSVDEYVALYWSDWGLMSTDSGSYRSHVYDYILEGQNINWNASHLEFNPKDYEITEPGEYTFLGRGDRKIWSFEGPCAMIDHGIGDIISMTKFALVSNFSSTLNMDQVAKLLTTEGRAVAHEYAQRLRDQIGCNAVTVQKAEQVSPEQFTKARQYFSEIMEHVPQKMLG